MEKGLGLCPGASRADPDSGDALSSRLISCNPHQPNFPDPDKVVWEWVLGAPKGTWVCFNGSAF